MSKRGSTFHRTGRLLPSRSVFDLSYTKVFDCDMGQLIPVMCDEVVPGDYFNISNEMVVRMQPMLAPILHEIYITTHYFFVPYRLLGEQLSFDFEHFITGGEDGNYTGNPPLFRTYANFNQFLPGSLGDFFGMPMTDATVTDNNAPSAFPWAAYNFIWNEYYRDENLQPNLAEMNNDTVLYSAWTKDYFTSALPWVQRGTVPAIPVESEIGGTIDLDLSTSITNTVGGQTTAPVYGDGDGTFTAHLTALYDGNRDPSPPYGPVGSPTSLVPAWLVDSGTTTDPEGPIGMRIVDPGFDVMSSAVTVGTATPHLTVTSTAFNVNDLRLAFQISKWQERNARAGVRYTEFLHAHFGVSPRDERLQRPEYIGGTRSPIIVSEVLQTSSTDETTPQGNMAGHGISVDSTHVGSYRASEFGLIMGLMKIHPKPSYFPQGVPRQWRRMTRFDYYFREFANLGEQAVLNNEIYTQGTNADVQTFGFQGRYDEMRVKQNMVCNGMRDEFAYWHLARKFDTQPFLNDTFIECKPDKRIFAVPSEPGFIVHYANRVKAVRPMPILAEPGLIDHF